MSNAEKLFEAVIRESEHPAYKMAREYLEKSRKKIPINKTTIHDAWFSLRDAIEDAYRPLIGEDVFNMIGEIAEIIKKHLPENLDDGSFIGKKCVYCGDDTMSLEADVCGACSQDMLHDDFS